MARPKKEIAKIVGINMVELASHILSMSDAEKAAWLTKAVHDCLNGCTDADADPFIKVQYDNTMNEIKAKQEYDARRYQQHKALCSGKPNTISTNDKTAEVTTPSAGESCATNYSLQEVPSRKDGNELNNAGNGALWNPPLSCRQSFTADGDSREGSLNSPDGSDAAKLESSTSATQLATTFCRTTSTEEARRSRPAAERGKGSRVVSLPSDAAAGSLALVTNDSVKKPYGTCGHVMLTDEEGRHLRELYGENLRIAIDILDAYIENGGKAAKRYKNHAAVMRKGNWVWHKVQEMKIQDKKLGCANKSFKQMDREHQSELMHTSLFAPSLGTTDNKRIANG